MELGGLQTTELREPPLLSKPTKLHCYQNPCLVSLFRSLSCRRSGGGGCAIRTRCRRWSGGGGASPSARAKFGSCNFVFLTRFGQIVVCNNNNNCCVELRGATAGAAELRGAAGSGGLYGRSRLAYVRKVRTLRETARARARGPAVWGVLSPLASFDSSRPENWDVAYCRVVGYQPSTRSNCYSVCNEIYFGLQPAKFGSCNLFITKFGQLCYATTTTVVLSPGTAGAAKLRGAAGCGGLLEDRASPHVKPQAQVKPRAQ